MGITISPQMVQMGIQVGTALFQKGKAEDAADELLLREQALNDLIDDRQSVVNPAAGVSAFVPTDYSDSFSNPFANLRVATKAAEIQMEQTDIALANTLDTLRMGGMGAGGATALAQAAKESKAGVAATIEQQEVNNEKLRAQGEQQLQQRIMSEKARVEGIKQSEQARVQSAEMAGAQFAWQAQEEREMAELDRAQAMIDNERANVATNEAGMFGTFGDLAASLGNLGSDWKPTPTPGQ